MEGVLCRGELFDLLAVDDGAGVRGLKGRMVGLPPVEEKVGRYEDGEEEGEDEADQLLWRVDGPSCSY